MPAQRHPGITIGGRKPPGAGVAVGQILYLLKLVPCTPFIYKLCISQSQHFQKQWQKIGVVGTIPTGTRMSEWIPTDIPHVVTETGSYSRKQGAPVQLRSRVVWH